MTFKSLTGIILFCCLLLNCFSLYAQQNDSLLLHFDQLNWKDVRNNNTLPVGTRVISGSRSERAIEDLPFTIYVITGEEIRQNGYLTLTDALKRLPGIRVSQPGSALEGETFLMRGLIGNTYAKILINDVPVKPFVVSGMPIGAQLPIRDAERIEIIYGPAATLYGADASAGVINIILKDSDRPVYAQADLGFGGDAYQNLDVMFGGKMGRGKRVLKFKVFGNYTAFNDRRIKYNTGTLYNASIYENILGSDGFSFFDRPNYRGFDNVPVLGVLPHQSNALGVELTYRKIQFSIQQYSRRDHSALGLSPYAVSYSNPLNYFGERIINANFRYGFTKNRFRFNSNLNVLTYNTDRRSSYSHVTPLVNFIMQSQVQAFNFEQQVADSISASVDESFFSGSRYSSANSAEGSLEFLMGYQFSKNIELAGGLTLQGGVGDPLRHFSVAPGNFNNFDQGIVNSEFVSYIDVSSFLETYINYKKWNAIIGVQTFKRQNDYDVSNFFILNPRLAIQYRWKEWLSLRFSSGRSLRYPSPFYSATSYNIDYTKLGVLETGADLSPEKTYNVEFGTRWKFGSKISADISAYYTRTTNFIRFQVELLSEDLSVFRTGYSNDASGFAQLFGAQGSIKYLDIIPSLRLNSTLNIGIADGREVAENISFIGEDLFSLSLDDIRALPKCIVQWDVDFKPTSRTRILFENTWMTKSLTRNMILYQVPDLLDNDQTINSGFYTLDALVSYQFNTNLLGYLKITNFFNKKYAGIDGTEDGDALLYNPQSQRFLRFGVNYRLE